MTKLIFIIFLVTSSFVSNASAQDDLSKSHVAMAYVCWNLANGLKLSTDSNSFSKMISFTRSLPDFKAAQYYEYMAYAAQEALKMSNEERKSIYQHSCTVPLKNIQLAEAQGMFN